MSWSTPATYTVGQVLRALDMNNISSDLSWVGTDLAYTEFTSNLLLTHTTEATADTIVTAGAVSFSGTDKCWIEFFSPIVFGGRGAVFCLYDGASSVGKMGEWDPDAGSVQDEPVLLRRKLTPSNASHTYSIRAYYLTSASTVGAGASGNGNFMPGYIRITGTT